MAFLAAIPPRRSSAADGASAPRRRPPPPRPAAPPQRRCVSVSLHPGRALYAALRHCRGPHGLSRRRRRDRRPDQSRCLSAAEGQVVQITLINGEGAEHDIVFPDQEARSPRITGRGASTTMAFRAQRSRRLHLFLQRARPPARRHAGQFLVTPRPPAQTGGGSRHLAARHRSAAADRRSRAADGAGRPARGRTRRPARRGDDVRLLDLQRQGAGAVAAGARRRHGRRTCEECGRQHHDPFGRLPRRDRPGRRCGRDPSRSRPREVVQVQGASAGPLCLSLRHADGGASHRQRHVRADPGRAGGRAAAGRPRILRDAGRDLYRGSVRPARQPGVQRREAA